MVAEIKIGGVGPGSAEWVTPIAEKTVEKAEVVIGSERALQIFEPLKGEEVPFNAQDVKGSLKYAEEVVEKGKTVAVLSTGDPVFSGLLRPLLNVVGEDVEVEVIPGISSIQVCAAFFNICWDTAVLFSFHAEAREERSR